jgi:putative oxidoreductase
MEKWLGRYSNVFYALMRFVAGVLFACHGAQKLFGILAGQKQQGLLQVAGIIEVVFGIMIAAGFFAGFAAFIAAGEMAVAYFKQHAPRGYSPMMSGGNGGELAILFLIIFLYVASIGSGSLSIDGLIARARRR